MAEPILKWAGGKRALIPHILSLFPKDYSQRNYHEPFIGAGAVFFKIQPKSGTINDINPRLINFFKVVRDKPEKLISQAKDYVSNKENFYQLRKKFNQPNLSDVEDASIFLYLNKTAFNGLYRVNSKGKFNVPFGHYKNPRIVPKDRIMKASAILKNIQIFKTDFQYILHYAKEGDVCYFDPPYLPISKTANFTSYSSNSFNLEDQKKLLEVCIKLDNKGVYFVLSNSYAKKILEMYESTSFRTETVKAKRVISSKASTRGPINELIVTNIPKEISTSNELPITHYIN